MSLSILPVFGAEIKIPLGASKQICENTDSCYLPSTINVRAGEIVTWTNNDSAAHTVTSTKDSFDSSIISSGKSFVFKFKESGKFEYLCVIHPWARGTVTVDDVQSSSSGHTESIEAIAKSQDAPAENIQEIEAKKQAARSQIETTTTEAKFKKQAILDRIKIPSLVLKTDSIEYEDGDKITITGKVFPIIKKKSVTLQLFNPEGDLVLAQQITPNKKSGIFSLKLEPGGDLWEESGTYSIAAQYYKYNYPAAASFDYISGSEPIRDIFDLNIDSQTFEIPYEIEGGIIHDMYLDSETPSLDITLEAPRDGILTIDIPQNLLDYEYGFVIMIDSSEAVFTDLDNGKLEIPFEDGSNEINIISLK